VRGRKDTGAHLSSIEKKKKNDAARQYRKRKSDENIIFVIRRDGNGACILSLIARGKISSINAHQCRNVIGIGVIASIPYQYKGACAHAVMI